MDEADRDNETVVAALREVGVYASSVFDLVNSSDSYSSAIPVLLDFLPKRLDKNIREGIARALTVKEARGKAAKPLIRAFRNEKDPYVRWAIANALTVVAEKDDLAAIATLARNKKYGKSREMLAIALGSLKDPRATPVLIELLDDEEIAGHAISGLRKLKPKEARRHVERFLDHPRYWVREEAKKALAGIDRRKR